MAGEDQTAMLREAAKARGFKLVKSRRRKAGGDFGKYGLTDGKGRECFGFGENGLTADAEAVLTYLRGGETASWKRSLMGVAGGTDAAKQAKTPRPADADKPVLFERSRETGDPVSSPTARAPRRRLSTSLETNGEGQAAPLNIRPATPKDAKPLAKLLATDAAKLKKNLAALTKANTIPLVADRGGVVGIIAWAIVPRLDRPPFARVTTLSIAEDSRRDGIGTALLAEAHKQLAKAKVADLELLLDLSLSAPAGFLRKAGWTRSANAWRRAAN